MIIEYHPAVEAELQEIRNFYETRSPGREGSSLMNLKGWRIGSLQLPGRWMVLESDIRRALSAAISICDLFPFHCFGSDSHHGRETSASASRLRARQEMIVTEFPCGVAS